MKRLIVILLFFISIAGYSQKWDGFFKPITKNEFLVRSNLADKAVTNVWLFRPAVTVTAVQLNWDKERKGFDATAFSSAGLGLGYQHFIDANGDTFNNYGFNALVLFGYDLQTTEPATISLALTGSMFQYLNLGILYNFSGKMFGILTGVAVKF